MSDPSGAGNGLTLGDAPLTDVRVKTAALGISDSSRIVVDFGRIWLSLSTRVDPLLD